MVKLQICNISAHTACEFIQCIDKARDLLDAELTAMAGESYSRAYGVSAPLRWPKTVNAWLRFTIS